jgi:N-acyl-D-aspartate/D-glutamate deacylase
MKLFLPDQYRRGNRRMIVLFLVISTNKKAICVLPWSSSSIGRWRRMAEGHVGQPVTTSCQQYLFKNCEAAQASLTARERDNRGNSDNLEKEREIRGMKRGRPHHTSAGRTTTPWQRLPFFLGDCGRLL